MKEEQLKREKGAAPLYYQLAILFKNKIESGAYQEGDSFPSEMELQEKYEISRITVRQAMAQLANEGYLESGRGLRTKVIYRKINEQFQHVVSFSEEMEKQGMSMTTSYCEIALEPVDSPIAAILEERDSEPAYRLERVRCANDTPVVYSVTYLNRSRHLSLDREQYMQSLYRYLTDTLGIAVTKGNDTFEAVLATMTIAEFLNIGIGMPVIKRTRKTYDQYGKVIEYTFCYYAGDKYKYSIEF